MIYNLDVIEHTGSLGIDLVKLRKSPCVCLSYKVVGSDRDHDVVLPTLDGVVRVIYAMRDILEVVNFLYIGECKSRLYDSCIFDGCENLKTVKCVYIDPNIDLNVYTLEGSRVFRLSLQSMFRGCKNLVDVPYFDTHLVGNFRDMFERCVSLAEIPLYNISGGYDNNGGWATNVFFSRRTEPKLAQFVDKMKNSKCPRVSALWEFTYNY